MTALRIVFMGTPELAAASLRALLAPPDLQIVAVVTQPDQPKGRGLHLQPSPVQQVAQQAGLPVLQPQRASRRIVHRTIARSNPAWLLSLLTARFCQRPFWICRDSAA